MNGLNGSDDVAECPLCMEPLEVDDLNFYPCTCGYQICRFCWHRIRTDENELCPACRKAYPENPADFKPLSQEQVSSFIYFFLVLGSLSIVLSFVFVSTTAMHLRFEEIIYFDLLFVQRSKVWALRTKFIIAIASKVIYNVR